ncbi:MAG: protein kinase [Proteobacteria bacterium]|nr:protein kinase [Pseudomonadota bacterium]
MAFVGSKRFQLISKLGEGGAGIVYDAYDQNRNMRVALKSLRDVDAWSLFRFKREFRALQGLSHPNIIDLYEMVSDDQETWLLTMELVNGVDFISYVQVRRRPVKIVALREDSATPDRIPVDQILSLPRLMDASRQLARALHGLHSARIVHRDLKPENVLVTQEGRVVLMDFGVIAEMRGPKEIGADGGFIGTPVYMAPEQILGARASTAADWYAFGVMLYLALTGRPPFEGRPLQVMDAKQFEDPRPPGQWVSGIPEDLEALCMRLLAREVVDRPEGSEVLAALGIPGVAPSATITLVNETDVFVGRTHELDELGTAYAQTRSGHAKCVFVRGPSGIGKTALLDRFIEELESTTPDLVVLSGRCHQNESLAYKAFDSAIDDLSRFLVELPVRQRARLLPQHASAIARLFPTLSQVPGCSKNRGFRGRDPLELRAQAFDALRELLARLAGRQPLLIRIEDLHWADRDSLELLRSLLQPPPPHGLLVLATIRTGDSIPDEATQASEWHGSDSRFSPHATGLGDELAELVAALEEAGVAREMRVGPLSSDEQDHMWRKLASHGGVSLLDLKDSMWKEAAGHPMLLTELARHIQEQPDPPGRTEQLNLKQVIWQRVSRLSDKALALAEIIAVAGEPTSLRALGDAARLSDIERERAASLLRLARLARHVVRPDDEPWLDSYHDKVREAITEHLSPGRAPQLHGQLATALEDHDRAAPATLARHWLAAGEQIRAVNYFMLAAQGAAEKLAIDRAATLYRTALDNMPEAVGDVELETQRCRAWIGLAEGMRIVEQNDEALHLLEQAEKVATTYQLSEDLASLHFLRGNLIFPTGDWKRCLAEHQKAQAFAHETGSLEYEARALGGMGDAYSAGGQMASAYKYMKRCVELCQQHGFLGIEVANLSQLAWFRFHHNELEQAVLDCDNSITAAASIGHRRAAVVSNIWRGAILTDMERLDEARASLVQAIEISRIMGMQRFVVGVRPLLGKVMALQGERDQAEAMLDETIADSAPSDRFFSGPLQYGVLALITEDPEVRRRSLEQGEELLQAGSIGHNYLFFYREAMEAALRGGDAEGIEHYAQLLEENTAGEPTPWSRFFVTRGRLLARHVRDTTDAESIAALRELRDRAFDIGFRVAGKGIESALERT